MKKLILTVAVLMGVSATTTTFANNAPAFNGIKIIEIANEASELQVKALQGLKFKLTLDNLDKKTYIAIKNASGEVMHSEYAYKTENFSKVYDLSNLVDGEYYFEVVTGKDKLIKSFEIATNVNRTATAL
ncbi:hypothetical protein EGI22_21870 [Lacihabitans sp. LS3-19]|uniref:hypothetical protein n=1 Tax=Lacihabitans sp. LS3-19 TaxID=2487335 RepID=UPI0020CF1F0A|nr:hypothetical protein [Lacihabitans sp. LS3-19]MCP9770564.1 hypothetical protein [Lacihabitans sp. LS3-19]